MSKMYLILLLMFQCIVHVDITDDLDVQSTLSLQSTAPKKSKSFCNISNYLIFFGDANIPWDKKMVSLEHCLVRTRKRIQN